MHSKICLQEARAVARPCELKNMHRIFFLNNAANFKNDLHFFKTF